jgi:hypothetical protein
VVDNAESYLIISKFRGQTLQQRARRGQKYFLNISKLENNLLSVIKQSCLLKHYAFADVERIMISYVIKDP